MSTTTSEPTRHPILGFARALGEALDRVHQASPVCMSTEEKRHALVELTKQAERLEAVRLRLMAVAQDVADADAARSVAAWVADQTRHDHGGAARTQRLADALSDRFETTGRALVAGQLNLEQAVVVVAAVDALPEVITAGQRATAEQHLVAQAEFFDPRRLRLLGERLLEVIAPDEADELLRRRLEDTERRARAATGLWTRRRGDGTTDIRIRASDAVASRLTTVLEAYAAPRRDHLDDPRLGSRDPETGERLSYPHLMGRAFGSLIEHVTLDGLPQHGGTATTVVITMTLDALRTRTGVGQLGTGEQLSAGEVRRLACNALLIPAVLGTRSEVLDLGRTSRLFSPAQRKAMMLRDHECRAAGCTIPATWCEGHHQNPWSRGGRTDISDGVLLCPFHHHRAHDSGYDTRHLPNGDVRFARRT